MPDEKPKWLNKSEPDKARDRWRDSQKHVAKKFGGREQPASGAVWCFKGDVTSKKILFECKYTDGTGIRVTEEMLRKIETEAVMSRKMPVLVLKFKGRTYYTLREIDFEQGVNDGTEIPR